MALVLVLLAACASVSVASGIPKNRIPGMVVYCTDECLAMWHKEVVFGEELRKKLNDSRVPGISGNISSVFWSSLGYDLKNITLTGYEEPEVHVSITRRDGIFLTVMIPEISFEGKFMLDYYNGNWHQYNRTGNFSISIRQTTVKMVRKTTLVADLEQIKYESYDGICSVKDIEIDLRDPLSNDLLAQMNTYDLKKLAEEELCKSYKFLTETKFSASYRFTDKLYLDKSFFGQPIVHDGYIEAHHRGEVRDIEDNEAFEPMPLPMELMRPHKMKVYRLSEFLFNSFGKIVYDHQLLLYTYTKSDLPEGHESLLDTSCELSCFGTLFPVAKNDYPDSTVELNVSTAEPPRVQITRDEFRVNLTLVMAAHARQKNGDISLLFTIRHWLSARVDVVVNKSRIHFETRHLDSNIEVIDSKIGELSEDKLLTVVGLSYKKVLSSAIALFKQDGFSLGISFPLQATRSEVKLNKGDVSVMFDYLKEETQ